MSVSVHIMGVIPADKKWKEYMDIYRLCEQNEVDAPDDVAAYLGADECEPSDIGREVSLNYEGRPEYDDGALIDLEELPNGVKSIRVFMR